MRAIVQRVAWAKVEIEGAVAGEIARGLLVYVGVAKGDAAKERSWLVDKIVNARIFANDAGKMDKSVTDISGSLLVISQFTLYGDMRRGRRPSFDDAMPPTDARKLYEDFVAEARTRITVATGQFGADMKVSSLNDGPVTLWIDTHDRE